jgi:hypothetical protein
MKQNDINWREKAHVSKSSEEKAAYDRFMQFLQAEIDLKPTEPSNLKDKSKNTNSPASADDEEEDSLPPRPPKGKSFLLKVKDLDFIFKNDWGKQITIGVIVTLICLLVWGYFTLWSDQKAQLTEIDGAKKDIESLITKYEVAADKITQLDKDYSISKAEFLKYLQYLKDRLNVIQE